MNTGPSVLTPHAVEVGETFFLTDYPSPLGSYLIVTSELGVVCLATEAEAAVRLAGWEWLGVRIRQGSQRNAIVAKQLDEYFAGRFRRFTLPLDLRGTPFQRQVWDALLDIPYGETRSYGDVARALGRPRSARAVGGANHVNPVAIVVPCHRVIGSNGSLTGYGGGLDRKKALLDLEAAAVAGDAGPGP